MGLARIDSWRFGRRRTPTSTQLVIGAILAAILDGAHGAQPTGASRVEPVEERC
jgi:hypothetical protein